MRAHAPPDLRVLVDRAGLVEQAHVGVELRPGAVGVGDAATREHAGEDLGAGGVQPAVHALDERRARRQREQVRQEHAQSVVHGDRAVGAGDPHVQVEPEGVVAPDHVAKQLVVPAVVRRVDDPLVLPAAPGCAPVAPRASPSPLVISASCARRMPISSEASAKVSHRPVRTSASDAISSPTRWSSTALPPAAAFTSSKRLTSESVSGSRSANSSSTATVRSVPPSKAARACSSSSWYGTFCASPIEARSLFHGQEQAFCDAGPRPALDGDAACRRRRAPSDAPPARRAGRAACRRGRPDSPSRSSPGAANRPGRPARDPRRSPRARSASPRAAGSRQQPPRRPPSRTPQERSRARRRRRRAESDGAGAGARAGR